MQRVNTPEILDSNNCPRDEVDTSLQDLCRINRWFGGVTTTRKPDRTCRLRRGREDNSRCWKLLRDTAKYPDKQASSS